MAISLTFEYFLISLFLSFLLGFLAYKKKIVDLFGFLSGVVVSIGILICMDIKFFTVFFSFVILGAIFTAYNWVKKKKAKLAEREEGRGISNVLGNGLPPLIFALFYALFPEQNLYLLTAYICAVSALVADTASSEVGVLSKGKPIMITTFKRVEKGTDGGISPLGIFAGIIASFIIGLISFILEIGDFKIFIIAILAGFIGNLVDSFVGATLERKKIFGKQETNFVCGISGGIVGIIMLML